MARVALKFDGDPRGAVSAVKKVISATGDAKEAAKTASATAIAAHTRERQALELLAKEYRAQAAAAQRGSAEQVAATRLAIQAERQLGVETRKTGGILGLFRGHTSAAGDELGKFGRGALAGSGLIGGLGRQVAFASGTFLGGAGLIGALTSTARAAGDLETELNTLQEVGKANTAQMEAARKKAVELGDDLTIPNASAADAAQAMTELAKAGLSVEESMEAAKGTLQLAAAAQTDNATAATIVGRALNAFNLEGSEAVKVADLLAGAANASTGDMTDFALGLAQAGAQAHLAGLTIDETVTALAELANAGIVGSDAGTSLRVMLQRLNPTTTKAKELISQLGISVYDAHGNMLPLRDIVVKYGAALEKLNPQQRSFVLNTIFGQDASRAAAIVLGQQTSAYDKLNAAVTRHGQASELAGARTKGYNGAVAALQNAIQTLQIEVGTALLPTLTKNIKALADWVSHLNDGGQAVRDVKGFVGGLSQALHAAKTVVETVDQATGGFKQTLELLLAFKVASTLAGWTAALKTFAGAEGLAGAASAAGGLNGRLRTLRTLTSKPFQFVVAYQIIKSITGSNADLSNNAGGPGDTLPIYRNGKWVDPITGKPVPDQAYWNQQFRQSNPQQKTPSAGQTAFSAGTSAATAKVLGVASKLGVGSGGTYQAGGGHSGIAKPGSVLDCSGYVYQAFTQAGFEGFPGTSEQQWATASGPNWTSTRIAGTDVRPGDVIFMVGSPKYTSPGHVGIVVSGSGLDAVIAEYYSTGKPPRASRKLGEVDDFVGAKRFFLVKHGQVQTAAPKKKPGAKTTSTSTTTTSPLDLTTTSASKKTATTLPGDVALQLAQAEGTKGIADDVAANQAAIDVLTARLRRTTDKSVKADLVNAINSYRQAITEARAKLTKSQAAAATKLPDDVKVRLARAKATNDLQDDIAANEAAIDVLQKRLKQTTSKGVKAELEVAIAGYKRAINDARKKLATAAAAATKRLADETTIKSAFQGAQATLQQAFTLDLLPVSEEDKLRAQESKLAGIIRQAERDGKISPAELSKIKASWKAMGDGITDAQQAVAEQAKRTFDRAWGGVTNTITRALNEQWQATVRDFNRETSRSIDAIQQKAAGEIQQMQRDFQARLAAFDRDTQAGLAGFVVAQTPAEKAYQDFLDRRQAEQDAAAAAQRQSDLQAAYASGDPQQIKQALDAIHQAELDSQEAALKSAADASRAAADAQTQAEQDAYQQQRDQLRQSLEDDESEREKARQTQADNDAQAYQDQRDAQMQALSDLHDDQMTALQQDLDDWNTWLVNKQRSYAAFLTWLAQNPTAGAVAGSLPTDFPGDTSPGGIAGLEFGVPTGINPSTGKPYIGFASGGRVPGRYIGRDDTIMARLTPGETVIDRRLTAALEQMVAGGGSVRATSPLAGARIYVLGATPRDVAQALRKIVDGAPSTPSYRSSRA